MTYTIAEIQNILNAEWLQRTEPSAQIQYLLTDTRRIAFPEQSLFFPLVGRFHDGHGFVEEAYALGVRNFIVAQNIDSQRFEGANFLKVPDVLRGLQTLAAAHRRRFSALETIGITGSNGKTIVKEWLFQLLREDLSIVRSPKSYNSQTGVPLSVWQINPTHDLGIFEAGISKTHEMAVLAPIVQPTVGIFTMIGDAHAEGFASIEEKISEKIQLFESCHTILYCADDPRIATALQGHFPTKKHATWSRTGREADLQIIDNQIFENKTTLQCRFDIQDFSCVIPFADSAAIANAATCLLALLTLRALPIGHQIAAWETLLGRFAHLEAVAMRLELKRGINGCLVVNDAYNSDFTSLSLALDFISQNANLSRTLILSDILQSGQDSETLYRKVAELLTEKGIARFVGIGDSIATIAPYLPKDIDFQLFKTTGDFLHQFRNADYHNQIVLLKGAREFGFERLAERFSAKAHKTVLEIDLNALTHNLSIYKKILRGHSPVPKIMAMVKASAYGNGSEEVARLLAYNHVDYLAVAYADEGIALRHAGVTLPIMVLNPESAAFDAMVRFDLEPEIYSLALLRDFADFVKGPKAKIHLKLDTGMHRLGFEPADIQEVINILRGRPELKVLTVFSHLAASENPAHDDFTHEQARRFTQMYDTLVAGIGYQPLRHIANSGAIVRFPEYRFDMVRLGIGLYGVDSSEAIQEQLQVVQTLKATISQIKNVAQSESVGYSRRGVLQRDSRIATISIGYADGLLRGASVGKFSVWLHGKLAPIVGSVCMDMTMVDVTDIPEAQEGDEVEIFGKNHPVQMLATALGTIPYEVFTNISERVKRVYFQE